MRKLFKNKKGFAMAELLAVSIVLLFIFSILFSNYLPLVAEYETRLSYNDVTAQYAAHYIRKMYKEALDDTTAISGTGSTKGEQLKSTISTGISARGYFTVYSGNSDDQIFSQVSEQENCERIIKQYGIEEIIITNYKLKDDKDTTATTKYVKGNYKKDSGSLYNYIKYLPNYEKSIYTGNDLSTDSIQLYRIILKTKDYGYATTPILYDYNTPGSCFEGVSVGANKLKITKYFYNEDNGCGKVVTIKNSSVKLVGGETGTITEIGDGVFGKNESDPDSNLAYNVEQVILSESVESIGKNAFKNSNLNKIFNLEKVDSIGSSAFENTQLDEVKLSVENETIGDRAFASNEYLKTIELPNSNIYSGGNILTKGLFAESGTKKDGIEVIIPDRMTEIGDEMFWLSKISSIDLNHVQKINTRAFSQSDTEGIQMEKPSVLSELIIPDSVVEIGTSSFDGFVLEKVYFGSELKLIGDFAFRRSIINNGSIDIPKNVSEISKGAFEFSNISNLTFSEPSELNIIGDYAFRNNDIISVNIPNSVETIGASAFSLNSNLSAVTLSNNLKSISNNLFYSTNITEIIIPNSVVTIGESAFALPSGNGLSSVSFIDDDGKDSKLTKIMSLAFNGQKNLGKFVIPSKVMNVQKKAFRECKALTEIYNHSTTIDFSVNWCSIFYDEEDIPNCDDKKLEGNNVYINYPGESEKTIFNIGGATNG